MVLMTFASVLNLCEVEAGTPHHVSNTMRGYYLEGGVGLYFTQKNTKTHPGLKL
jgi:hypothetical protein